ncbi:Bifunctional coenzyme A synthase [Taenia crassiceps]|uniref:Bifunctional coenzyme A synthase n=1 Tax=Taenia crassiceps TaxID=6207 RepID=A0ABR4QNY7_9CEST
MHQARDPVPIGLLIVNSDLSMKGISSILRYASIIVSKALRPRVCPNLDVCLLLPRTPQTVINKSRIFDVVITDDMTGDEKEIIRLASTFDVQSLEGPEITTYPSVCVGGTFDMFHHGHRVILGIAALLTGCRLLVGVTDICLIHKKCLAPLIQTCESREATLLKFLTDIDFPEKQLVIHRLTDPYGPPSRQPDFQCIIASPETVSGCEKINEMRRDLNFDPLHIEKVDYVARNRKDSFSLPRDYADFKFSSSTLRLNLLGRPISRLFSRNMQPKPDAWVIGLTGVIASGKSTIANYLKRCDNDRVHLVNGDAICRRVYECDSESCTNLDNHLIREILKRLDVPLDVTTFEQSRISSLVKSEVNQLLSKQHARPLIVVLESTLLYEVGLDAICNEIWSVFIPRSEAVNRAEARCIVTDEAMLRSVRNQTSESKVDWWTPCQRDLGVGPIGRANVVFCTAWDMEFTREQVERAWQYLLQAISPPDLS